MSDRKLEVIEMVYLETMARIMGPSSAAQKALEDHAVRIERGERVGVYLDRRSNTILVGPVLK